ACRTHRSGEGHVRHRRHVHGRRQPGLARRASAATRGRSSNPKVAGGRRHDRRQDRVRRIFLQRHRRQRALRHSRQSTRPGPASGRLLERLCRRTGGSVRVPAAFCGVSGIRPTHGCIDMTGVMPMAPSFDVPGWFANGPGVFRRVGEVLLEGGGVREKPRQLIILDDAFAEADAEVASLLRAAIDAMASDLPKPSHKAVAPGGFDTWRESFRIIQAREIWSIYGPFVERDQPKLGPGIRERMAFAATVSERDADTARQEQKRARERICALVEPGTVLALPTAPCIAPRIDTGAEALESFRVRVMRLTCVAGLSGLPQVTLPVASISGCPIGLSFIAWHGGDEALLDLAVQLARHVGGVSGPRPE